MDGHMRDRGSDGGRLVRAWRGLGAVAALGWLILAAACGGGPLVLSAAFTRTLSPEKQKALRHRWFRLHFQYLCAFDRPGDYDYFAITAGPLRLGQRFAGRSHSPGRIARAVNKWTAT